MRAAERVVLPGQGAMPDCMRELRESGLQESVLEAAAGKPLFGVCVGMQMLLDRSDEGRHAGPGLIHGDVVKFELAGRLQPDGSRYKVPQMGWNQVHQQDPAGRTRFGRACPTAATSISSTATTPDRRMRATARARPTTARALPRRLHAIIFLRPSSTPKKAPTRPGPVPQLPALESLSFFPAASRLRSLLPSHAI